MPEMGAKKRSFPDVTRNPPTLGAAIENIAAGHTVLKYSTSVFFFFSVVFVFVSESFLSGSVLVFVVAVVVISSPDCVFPNGSLNCVCAWEDIELSNRLEPKTNYSLK